MSQCQVRIWDAKSGQEMLSLVPKGGSPTGLAFTPDGRRLLASLSGRGTAHVAAWDAGPLPVEVEAALLVDRLAANRLTRAEVRSAVVAEPSLPADIRARALERADAWPEDCWRLIETSRAIAGQPARPAGDYRRALAYADTAMALAPDDADVLCTRGLARLRAGQLAAARDDLAQSVHVDPSEPASWGLLALAEARLGHHSEAYSALGQMTRLLAGGAPPSERLMPPDLKREAETLILDARFPDEPFAR